MEDLHDKLIRELHVGQIETPRPKEEKKSAAPLGPREGLIMTDDDVDEFACTQMVSLAPVGADGLEQAVMKSPGRTTKEEEVQICVPSLFARVAPYNPAPMG